MSGGMILLIAVDTLDCILWFGYLVGVAGTSPSDSSVCSARHPYPNYGGGGVLGQNYIGYFLTSYFMVNVTM